MIKINSFKLGKLNLGLNHKPILVGEISANHNGNIDNVFKIIDQAKLNMVDAIKLQTFTPDTMTLNLNTKDFKISHGLWKGYNLYELYKKAQTPLEWHKRIFSYCKKLKIECFSTPFDETAVDFLEKLNCPFYKVASFEMTDLPLLKAIAKTKKPVIVSTGLATLTEIERSIKILKKYGSKKIVLLYCVSSYPAKIDEFNLNNLQILNKKFKLNVGLSDHSKDIIIATSSITLGACIIEKHISLKGQRTGLDIDFSLKGEEIKELKDSMIKSWLITKNKKYVLTKRQKKNLKFRRSVYCIKDIKKGEKFTKDNIKNIRPGYGASPMSFDNFLGKKTTQNIKKGTRVNSKFLK